MKNIKYNNINHGTLIFKRFLPNLIDYKKYKSIRSKITINYNLSTQDERQT